GKLTVLMITAFVDMLGLAMVIPLLPFYATKLGASATIVGVLIAAFWIAQLASAPLWGRVSDRYGRRPALLAGLLVSAVAYVIFAYASTLWLLLLSRIVQGLGGGTIGVVQAYVADASDPNDRAKSLGWLSAATSLGAVVGPAIGSALIHWGRHAPGIASAIFCVLVSVFAWTYLRESKDDTVTSEHEIIHQTSAGAVWSVIAHPGEPAQKLIWLYAIAIGAFYGTVPTLPLLLANRLPITESNVGYFVMYLGGMGVFVRAGILGRMIEWLGEVRLTRLGLVLLAIGLAVVAAVHSYLTLLLALTLMPLGTAFVFPCVTAMLSRVVPKRHRGLYMGVQHTFGGISRVVFPLAAGVAMDHLGLGFPFVVAGVLVLSTLLLTTSMERYAPSRAASVT
ncbi:MAG TPA: MFS transporter, partial [Gemmatimonadaceae bacterium]|nr:MFS transporter [Gemmatimonadaceae bacterium]